LINLEVLGDSVVIQENRSHAHCQHAAVPAAVKDKPAAALNERRPRPPLDTTASGSSGRDGRMAPQGPNKKDAAEGTSAVTQNGAPTRNSEEAILGDRRRYSFGFVIMNGCGHGLKGNQ
jgi:hypothetical protein